MQTTDVVDIRIEQELKEILETQGVRFCFNLQIKEKKNRTY